MKLRAAQTTLLSICLLFSISSQATVFELTFYEWDGVATDGINIFDDYRVAGIGTFEIDDSAVSPNNLVLFSNPAFLSFDLTLDTLVGSATFTLGIDDFPDGVGPNPGQTEQGILFDSFGIPLRFETPGAVISNTNSICDPDCVNFVSWVKLIDDNSWDGYFLADGTVVTSSTPLSDPGVSHTRLGGRWGFIGEPGITIFGNNIYQISQAPAQAVPVPATVLLMLPLLFGFPLRRSYG